MKKNNLYVDNSNVWIEGMRVSAVHRGLTPSYYASFETGVVDRGWRLDFGRLKQYAGGPDAELRRANLYGSRPPDHDSLWAMCEREGFEVIVHDRNAANREKKVDTQLSTDLLEDVLTDMDPADDEVTLVSGDGDHVPAVEKALQHDFEVHVVFWDHATAGELKDVATSFTDLTPQVDYLSYRG